MNLFFLLNILPSGIIREKREGEYSKFEMQSSSDPLCLLHSRKTIFWFVNFFQPR